VVLPPGPNSWPLNIPAACSVPARTAAFCWPYPHFLLRFLAIRVLLCRNEDGWLAFIGHATKIETFDQILPQKPR